MATADRLDQIVARFLAGEGLLDPDGDFDSWTLLHRVARGEHVFRDP